MLSNKNKKRDCIFAKIHATVKYYRSSTRKYVLLLPKEKKTLAKNSNGIQAVRMIRDIYTTKITMRNNTVITSTNILVVLIRISNTSFGTT